MRRTTSILTAIALALIVSARAQAQRSNPLSVPPTVPGFSLPGVANPGDYLSVTEDAPALERAIESHLNRSGLHASTATGKNGAIHFVLLGFNGTDGLPSVQYRIGALPPAGENNQHKTQFIFINFSTNVRVNQTGEPFYAALSEANKVGNCAWHVEGGEVRCRSWLQIPNPGNPIPAEMVRDKILLINHDWLKFSPQILLALK